MHRLPTRPCRKQSAGPSKRLGLLAVLAGLLMSCDGEGDDSGQLAQDPCQTCDEVAHPTGALSYTGDNVRSLASGHWEGAYMEDDHFGPVTFTLDVELGGDAYELAVPVGCENDQAALGRCTGLIVEGRVVRAATPPDWDGVGTHVKVRGTELSCLDPSEEVSSLSEPDGCIEVGGFETPPTGPREGEAMNIKIDTQGAMWAYFASPSVAPVGYVSVGERLDPNQ